MMSIREMNAEKYTATIIKNYILHLKKTCELSVSLHGDGDDNPIICGELAVFNIHDNSYCTRIKQCPEARAKCLKNQKTILDKCKDGEFFGTCYAGVSEYIYPVEIGGKIKMYISVGGYIHNFTNKVIYEVSKEYDIPQNELSTFYSSLKTDMPSKDVLDALIYPLQCMLEFEYTKMQRDSVVESFGDKIANYIKLNRNEDISSKDICKHFYCSRSKVSHAFNSSTGMSIKKYINLLRIRDAKELLKSSSLTITEVAFSVGFKNSNYFTQTFKDIVGITPSTFRNQL